MEISRLPSNSVNLEIYLSKQCRYLLYTQENILQYFIYIYIKNPHFREIKKKDKYKKKE